MTFCHQNIQIFSDLTFFFKFVVLRFRIRSQAFVFKMKNLIQNQRPGETIQAFLSKTSDVLTSIRGGTSDFHKMRTILALTYYEILIEICTFSQGLLPDVDPLTIPEFHKHMVRSPPPVNWPRSPVFRFENSSQVIITRQQYNIRPSSSPRTTSPLTSCFPLITNGNGIVYVPARKNIPQKCTLIANVQARLRFRAPPWATEPFCGFFNELVCESYRQSTSSWVMPSRVEPVCLQYNYRCQLTDL